MADCADLYFVRSFASGICFYERQYYIGVIDIQGFGEDGKRTEEICMHFHIDVFEHIGALLVF